MLRIYPVLLELVRSVMPLVKALERHDPDLARPCGGALSSAPLNVAEGSYSRGRNRAARYHTALGSLREVLACFEVAAALGYVPEVDPELRSRFDHVLGTLVRLVGGHSCLRRAPLACRYGPQTTAKAPPSVARSPSVGSSLDFAGGASSDPDAARSLAFRPRGERSAG